MMTVLSTVASKSSRVGRGLIAVETVLLVAVLFR
jgi:hypothetical protein